MHWIDTRGVGSVVDAGPRSDDVDSQSASVVMYDTGKILKTGGGPGYDQGIERECQQLPVIDVNAGVAVRKIAPMAYHRAFQNTVVLPNGQVLILGGQTFPVTFTDGNSVLAPELFDPVTETFQLMPAMAAPRNYHSVAILLPDGRVLSAGGGLCGAGCSGNHATTRSSRPTTCSTRTVHLLRAPPSRQHRPSCSTANRSR